MSHSHHGHDDHSGHAMPAATTASPAMIIGDHDHSHHSGHGDPMGMDGNHSSMGMDGNHSAMGMDHGSHSMGHHSMFFHGGMDETILFEFWKISETGGLILSMIIIFFLAFAYEGLKFYREHLYRHSFQTVQLSTVAVPVENGTVRETHKTVQIGTAFSMAPNPEINPVLLTHITCECEPSAAPGPSSCSKECEMKDNQGNLDNNNDAGGCGECSAKQKRKCRPIKNAYKVKVFSAIHGWQTVLHIVQMVISYFLMLIFMTYNVWLCIAVALGAGAGYFCFGWKKSVVVDVTEHCH
ncbi:High affinity copper uptake protein 1 [Orchesella cincta]|uniref:Copper transport protein n=1 Tax=Orchesella cincta TaxID=48709 RepID=A0A1D2NN08_ORCCI|nr:High affinity copper uptake protein 1 [Orchesella cincta]